MRNDPSKFYRQTQMDSAPAGRHIEISILEMANGKLRAAMGEDAEISWSRDLDEALRFNQKVWDVFAADWMAEACPLEQGLREKLLSLAVFVKKRTFTITAQPTRGGVDLLVALNEQIIDGLRRGLGSADVPIAPDGAGGPGTRLSVQG